MCLALQIRQLTHDDEADMRKALRTLWAWAAPLSFIIVIAWPLLALPAGVLAVLVLFVLRAADQNHHDPK